MKKLFLSVPKVSTRKSKTIQKMYFLQNSEMGFFEFKFQTHAMEVAIIDLSDDRLKEDVGK